MVEISEVADEGVAPTTAGAENDVTNTSSTAETTVAKLNGGVAATAGAANGVTNMATTTETTVAKLDVGVVTAEVQTTTGNPTTALAIVNVDIDLAVNTVMELYAPELQQWIGPNPAIRYNTPEWEEKATRTQQFLCQVLGNRQWDVIPKGQRWRLERKVGYWLFSEPKLAPSSKNKYTGYTQTQLKQIEELCDKMTKGVDFEEEDIHFAVACIVVGFDKTEIRQRREKLKDDVAIEESRDPEERANAIQYDEIHENEGILESIDEKLSDDDLVLPVFLCKAATSNSYVVVDSWHGRIYKSWTNFLNEEKLNLPGMCRYCAPKGGFYDRDSNGNVLVEFHYPNADSTGNKILAAFQQLLKLANLIKVVASLAVPIGPVYILTLNLAGVAYDMTYAVMALKDRHDHGQSVDWNDEVARGHWVTLGLATVSAGTLALGAAGKALKETGAWKDHSWRLVQGARLVLMFSETMSPHVLGISNEFVNLMKLRRYRELNRTDFAKLVASALAFGQAAIKFENPDKILAQAATDGTSMVRAGISWELFKKSEFAVDLFKGVVEQMGVVKNFAQEARDFEIDNTMDLLRALAAGNPMTSSLEKHFTKDGQLIIDRSQLLAPIKWLPLEEQWRIDLHHTTERYAQEVDRTNERLAGKKLTQSLAEWKVTKARRYHQNCMQELCKKYRISFEDLHEDAIYDLCTSYSEISERRISSPGQILVGDRAIFANLSGHQKTRLAQVLQETLDNRTDLVRLALDFAEVMKCGVFRKFLKYAEYIAAKFYEKRNEILNDFRQQILQGQTYTEVREHIAGLVGVQTCDGPLIQYADALALQHFSGENAEAALESLRDAFEDWKASGVLNSEVGGTGVLSSDLASHRYQKLKYFDFVGYKLQSAEDIYELVEKVSGRPVNEENVMMVQDGSCTIVSYRCSNQGDLIAVVINKLYGDDGVTSGIVTCMTYQILFN